MEKILLVLGFLLFAAAFSMTLPGDNQLFAVSGCCKQRDSYSGNWYGNGKNFEECERLNQEKDRDNVFDQRGLVWWDVGC